MTMLCLIDTDLEESYQCDCEGCQECGVEGCTDDSACNYDESATVDDGSCA